VLLDGRRVNAIDLSGTDWTQIPLEQVERIEIIRGTGSVLYGDNAVGGVINIITKTPSEKWALSASTSFGSYSRNQDLFSISGGQGKIAGALFGSYDASQGYRDNNELRVKDIGGKIVFDATDFLSFNLSGSYNSNQYGLPGPLPAAELAVNRRASSDPDDQAEMKTDYVKTGFDWDLSGYGNIVADLSFQNRKSTSDFPDPSFPFLVDSQIDTWAFTPRYVLKKEVLGHSNTLIAGVDLYWADGDTSSYSGFFSPVATLTGVANIARDSSGFYVSDEFSILENLILSLGARHEQVEYDLHHRDLSAFPLAPLDETTSESENAYSAGLSYLYNGKSNVFARANRSFRFPLTDELVVFDFAAGKIRVDSGLQPQTGTHYDVGVRHFFRPNLQGNLTLFRAEIQDEIFYNRATFSNQNYPQALHQGAEIGFLADVLERVSLYGNFTYEKAVFETGVFDGNEIPGVPRQKMNLGFRIRDLVPGLAFTADYSYVGSSYLISDQANQFQRLGSYYTINARLSYAWKRLKAFFGVNNITNQAYSEYGVLGGAPVGPNYYPAPERNWVGGLQVAF
jgi:iron complex outermembrane receptor protein